MIGWQFFAGVVVGLVLPVIVVVGIGLCQYFYQYTRERITNVEAAYKRIRYDGPDQYIRIVEREIDFSTTGRLERLILYVFLRYAKYRTSGTICGKNTSLSEIFDEEYGIDLDADEVEEWDSIITGLRDVPYGETTTISVRSPQEIYISKSEYTNHMDELILKSVIEQSDHFAITETPTVSGDPQWIMDEVTVKYTG